MQNQNTAYTVQLTKLKHLAKCENKYHISQDCSSSTSIIRICAEFAKIINKISVIYTSCNYDCNFLKMAEKLKFNCIVFIPRVKGT